jgi:hypothetical protein
VEVVELGSLAKELVIISDLVGLWLQWYRLRLFGPIELKNPRALLIQASPALLVYVLAADLAAITFSCVAGILTADDCATLVSAIGPPRGARGRNLL